MWDENEAGKGRHAGVNQQAAARRALGGLPREHVEVAETKLDHEAAEAMAVPARDVGR
jgi:hypothetical protein